MSEKKSIQIEVSVENNNADISAHVAVPVGRTLITKDEHLPNKPGKAKRSNDSKSNPKDHRWVAVIDKNDKEELAVVKLTTQNTPNTTHLPTYKKGNKKDTYFKNFVEIEDNEGNPIVVGDKFKENAEEYDLSKEETQNIKDVVYGSAHQAKRNRKLYNKLKKRK